MPELRNPLSVVDWHQKVADIWLKHKLALEIQPNFVFIALFVCTFETGIMYVSFLNLWDDCESKSNFTHDSEHVIFSVFRAYSVMVVNGIANKLCHAWKLDKPATPIPTVLVTKSGPREFAWNQVDATTVTLKARKHE